MRTATTTQPPRSCHDDIPDWSALLPPAWRDMAEVPLHFVTHCDYEMPAARCLGYDADDRLCYCAHRYVIETCRSDDDEDFYRAVEGGEIQHAWRLRDGRWLIYRLPLGEACDGAGRGFYSFSEQAPR